MLRLIQKDNKKGYARLQKLQETNSIIGGQPADGRRIICQYSCRQNTAVACYALKAREKSVQKSRIQEFINRNLAKNSHLLPQIACALINF